jgi:hypothetical protein
MRHGTEESVSVLVDPAFDLHLTERAPGSGGPAATFQGLVGATAGPVGHGVATVSVPFVAGPRGRGRSTA